jgi:hypothetical protein
LEHRPQAWNHPRQTWERLGAPATCLEALTKSLGARRFMVKYSGKNIVGNAAAVRLEILATTHHSMTFKTHVFSLEFHLYVYISICVQNI